MQIFMKKEEPVGNISGLVNNLGLGEGDVAAALKAGMKCAGVEMVTVNDIPCAVVPEGVKLKKLEKYLDRPARLRAERIFEEPDSFCAYVEAFKNANTRMYGEPDKYLIAAALDDHAPGVPSWLDHKAALQLQPSPEWKAWMAACDPRAKHGQLELAEFLDDHLEQIAEPDAGVLQTGVRTIQIGNNWRCTSVQHEGGDIAFSMNKENTAQTASGKLPSRLTLSIAPFRSWHPVSMTVYLSYRLQGERLEFTMRAHQSEEILGQSFQAVRVHVAEQLKLPVLV